MVKIPRRTLLASPLLLTRAQAQTQPDLVRFSPEIEPLVRAIEVIERERSAAWLAAQLQRGTPYRHLLAAVFLAGIRNVNARPPGFALHCVFLAHAAHQLSLEAPADLRALPLFYVLDDFKAAQARDAGQKTGDYSMRMLPGGAKPAPKAVAAELTVAMDAWDPERAERAAAALARSSSPTEAFELLWRYGARDYRNIGHKAIFVANASRTLQTIGWQHAEPVLRSVVLGLLDFGREQKMNGFALNDQCFAGNEKRVRDGFARLPGDWTAAATTGTAETRALLKTMRMASVDEACAETAARLAKGNLRAGAVWEAVHLSAAELRMRASGANTFTGVHAVTAANGLHVAYLSAADPRLRYLLLLQGVGWMGQFRQFAEAKPELMRRLAIDDLEPAGNFRLLDEVMAAIPARPAAATADILALAPNLELRSHYLNGLMRNSITKADEVHFYKYLVSLLETLPLVSPAWQPHLLAATAYYAKGSGDPEPVWAQRTREALRTVKV